MQIGKITNNGPSPIYSQDEFGKTVRLEVGQSIDFKTNPYRMTDAVDVALPPMPEPEGGKLRYDHTGSLLPEPSFSADQVRAYAIQAVMAERDRCAKIAASYATCGCNGKHGRCTEDDGPLSIAAAIRAQPEPKA